MSAPHDDSDRAPAAARLRIVFAATATSDDEARWTLHAAQALDARGHDVAIATPAGAALAATAAARNLSTRPLRTGARLDPRVGRAARQAFAAPDAVIALDPEALELAHRAAARLVFARAEQPAAWVGAHARTAAVFVPPGAGVDSNGTTPPARVMNDIATAAAPSPRRDPTAARRALRLPRRVHLVLHVAPLAAGGGQETMLRALAKVVQQGAIAPPTVAFLGTGPDEAHLHVLAQDLCLKDHVLWLGMRKDVAAYLAAVDSLVVPSVLTPRGVWLDALALGIPIMALDTPAMREGLGDAAALVRGDVAEAWAAELTRVCAPDGAVAARLAERGREQAAAELSASALAADLECAVYAHDLRRLAQPRRAALFLDRDGTLVRNRPYNTEPDAVVLEPRAGRALRWARDAGFALVVTSNQSGIGRGLVTVAQVEAIHARIRALLRPDGADLDALYFCPHLPDDACDCRKPQPGLLLRAAADLDLDITRSIGIGDAPRDAEAARAAGAGARAYRGADTEPQPWSDGVRVYDDWLALVRDVLAEAWAAPR